MLFMESISLIILQAESTIFSPHEAVVKKVHQLVDSGLRKASDVGVLLKSYVKTELLQDGIHPDATDRRFFPDDDMIRNIMYK
jgi:hypothetical protein